MNTLKNNLLFVSLCTFFSVTSYIKAETNFEFYNKDEHRGRVKITVTIDNKTIVSDKIVDWDEAYQASIDPQHPVKLTVFTTNQQYRHFILNAPGKTKFLSWNTGKSFPLYPQTGPLKGLIGRYNPFGKGKTESGLPLNNNLSESQIKETK